MLRFVFPNMTEGKGLQAVFCALRTAKAGVGIFALVHISSGMTGTGLQPQAVGKVFVTCLAARF